MSNYNYTPYNYFTSSVLSQENKKEERNENQPAMRKMESFIEVGLLYSIELRRNEIKKRLTEYFEFEDDKAMLDFLSANIDVLQALPQIAKYILTHISSVFKLSVHLLNENTTWKTLFINIYSGATWEETNMIFNEIFNILYETRPSVFDKVNFNFCQE